MDINEAIQHCLDIAKQCDLYKVEIEYKCGEEHRRIADWLMELKDLRGAQDDQYVFIHELMNEIKVLKNVIRRIYTETTTDHYGDSLIVLENIDKILNETRSCWNEV